MSVTLVHKIYKPTIKTTVVHSC